MTGLIGAALVNLRTSAGARSLVTLLMALKTEILRAASSEILYGYSLLYSFWFSDLLFCPAVQEEPFHVLYPIPPFRLLKCTLIGPGPFREDFCILEQLRRAPWSGNLPTYIGPKAYKIPVLP